MRDEPYYERIGPELDIFAATYRNRHQHFLATSLHQLRIT